MIKSEIIDWVCDKVGQEEDEEKAKAGNFLQGRLRLIWNQAMWLDALMELTMAIDPVGNLLHACGLVPLPSIYERILGARTDDLALDGQQINMRYRVDHDMFEESGTPCVVSELGAAVWIYDSAVQLKLTGNDDETDAGKTVFIRYVDEAGQRREETWNVVTGKSYTLSVPAVRVEALLKQETNNAVQLIALYDGVTETVVETLAASMLQALKPIWLRLGEKPRVATTLRTLGKIRAPEWRDDESPPIRNAEDVLIAYGLGDMEQRQRQFGRANAYFSEGGALLTNLMQQESDQTVQRQRLIPDAGDGYESEFTSFI